MALSDKQEIIKAFFSEFGKKIDRLQELRAKGFDDEAFTLCLVYIDRLASGHFGGTAGQNRKNFYRALAELSGNPLFGMVHPRQLRALVQDHCPSASTLVDAIVNRQPDALLDEKDIAEEVRRSSLSEDEKNKVMTNLWRASLANIAYDFIRVAEAHGPGSGGLSFDKTIYRGQTGVSLDFTTLFEALKKILNKVTDTSNSTGEWFGNPNYMKERF